MLKTLVIFGATGMQGGSIVTAIQTDPTTANKYKIRAVTRDASKPKAKALAEKGVELVVGDLDNKESLKKAVEGAYAIFAVTDFWATMDADNELQQGKNIVDAAKVSYPTTRLLTLGCRSRALCSLHFAFPNEM